jgi:histidine triad (HIT) family protein
MACPFCEIVAGRAPVSLIHADETILAFMTLRPFAPGECTVIPRAHIDHFTDLDDDTAKQIIVAAQRIGRRMRAVFAPERVGMVVHGYGVPHAHLVLVPQHGPYDITSARYAQLEDGKISFSLKNIPVADRTTLDQHARLLADSSV